jgi:hypothetical protein
MTIPAYPLQWPHGWKRTQPDSRKQARFNSGRSTSGGRRLSIYAAATRVRTELQRMGIPDPSTVISSNVALRVDGWPRSDTRQPADPGVAVYWVDGGGATRCMAIDIYDKVADNLAAVAASLDALRAIERHGGATIQQRAFTGFTALPPPSNRPAPPPSPVRPVEQHWSDVLGVSPNCSTSEARAAYNRLRGIYHPDRPDGDADKFHAVQNAWRQVSAEHGAQA